MKAVGKVNANDKMPKQQSKKLVCVWETPQMDSHFLPEILYTSTPIQRDGIDPGEQALEDIPVLRILYPQTRWKKPVESISSS